MRKLLAISSLLLATFLIPTASVGAVSNPIPASGICDSTPVYDWGWQPSIFGGSLHAVEQDTYVGTDQGMCRYSSHFVVDYFGANGRVVYGAWEAWLPYWAEFWGFSNGTVDISSNIDYYRGGAYGNVLQYPGSPSTAWCRVGFYRGLCDELAGSETERQIWQQRSLLTPSPENRSYVEIQL